MSNQDLTLASVGIVDTSTLHFQHKEFKVQVQVPALKGSPAFKTKLTAFAYESVGSLKLDLFKKSLSKVQVNPGAFQLLFKGSPLIDDSLIGGLGLGSHSVLHLKSNSSVGLLIHVQNDNGAYWDMRVKPSLAVADLKQMIYKKKGYPVDHQTLKFGQQILQDEKLISDFELIKDGTNFDLFLASVPIKVFNEFNGEATSLAFKASDSVQKGKFSLAALEKKAKTGGQIIDN